MGITAAGVGSGIDIESILSQLNELERAPINALNERTEDLNVELSAYGTIKSALSEFDTTADALGSNETFGEFVASSSDEEVFTATANNGQTPERHDVEVLSLATNHRLTSAAYDSADSTVDNGTLSFSSGSESFDVIIDSSNNTLAGLKSAINNSVDNSSVSASIINVDGGSRLVLTAINSGTEGQINVTRQGESGLPIGDSASGFSEITEATDANLIVHGFSVTSSSNSVSNVIDGVTLELTGVGTATVDSRRNLESLKASVEEFIDKYNSLIETTNDLASSDLRGNSLPRGIETQLRTAFLGSVDLGDSDTATLLELGFSFDRNGKLSLDSGNYESALELGVNRYIEAFAKSDTGFSARFTDIINEYTQAGGVIDIREDGIDTRKRTIEDKIEQIEYRLEISSERLRRQYTAMDLAVSNLNSTSNYLASRLSTF